MPVPLVFLPFLQDLPQELTLEQAQSPACQPHVADMVVLLGRLKGPSHLEVAGEQQVGMGQGRRAAAADSKVSWTGAGPGRWRGVEAAAERVDVPASPGGGSESATLRRNPPAALLWPVLHCRMRPWPILPPTLCSRSTRWWWPCSSRWAV